MKLSALEIAKALLENAQNPKYDRCESLLSGESEKLLAEAVVSYERQILKLTEENEVLNNEVRIENKDLDLLAKQEIALKEAGEILTEAKRRSYFRWGELAEKVDSWLAKYGGKK